MIAEAWDLVNNLILMKHIHKNTTWIGETKNKVDELEQEVSVGEIVNITKSISNWFKCDFKWQDLRVLWMNSKYDETGEETEHETVPTHRQAFTCFALKLMERQPECDSVHLLVVTWLRDFAAWK